MDVCGGRCGGTTRDENHRLAVSKANRALRSLHAFGYLSKAPERDPRTGRMSARYAVRAD